MNHETTIKRIQELVPSVMALEEGCRISVIADGYGSCNESSCDDYSAGIDEVGVIVKGCNEIVFRDGSNIDDIYVSSFQEGFNEDYEMMFEILGKPITIGVALMAIAVKMNMKPGNRGGELIDMWDLSKDNFNDQSDETKAFIGGLLN